MDSKALFWELWNCKNELEVNDVIDATPILQMDQNWQALGGQQGNQGVVENQQAKAAAALVEKIINSIDAILMRKCYEANIDPKSLAAPRSVDDAIRRFFPDYKNWDLTKNRVAQARDLQVLADSSRDSSIVIYDAGEGQRPKEFEQTFCSLLRGNKDKIHFVQGRFNMGGSGVLPFCGRKRYQLIGSKRFDGGAFGFTLIREHPHSGNGAGYSKNSWYEYFVPQGEIPSFEIAQLDLGLHEKMFDVGTVLKLFSYNTKGNSDLRRDMGRSLNEYLFAPALPYFVVERKQKLHASHETGAGTSFGLSSRLARSEHIEEHFTQTLSDPVMGFVNIGCYVFKVRTGGRDAKTTRRLIRDEFFRNNMVVLFTLNGQTHAHLDRRFITNSLGYDLLKEHLLIHVDCTNMKHEFRKELFMASRDRMRESEEAETLRTRLRDVLKGGQLEQIYRRRKAERIAHSSDPDELVKSIVDKLTIDENLRKHFGQSLKLDARPKRKRKRKLDDSDSDRPGFHPQRYPSFFNLKLDKNGTSDVFEIPRNGTRKLIFESDVENEYFDRVEDPGSLQLGVMTWRTNENYGGDERGTVNDIGEILSVEIQSPNNGDIRVVLKPTIELQVGEEVQIRARLGKDANPNYLPPQMFWIRIVDARHRQKPSKREELPSLPDPVLVAERPSEDGVIAWDEYPEFDIDHGTVMHPFVEGSVVEKILVNMDSSVFKNHCSTLKSSDAIELARRKYIVSVYCHTLFLYTASRQRGYEFISQQNGDSNGREMDLSEYLKDIFASHYAGFLLDFSPDELKEALAQ